MVAKSHELLERSDATLEDAKLAKVRDPLNSLSRSDDLFLYVLKQ